MEEKEINVDSTAGRKNNRIELKLFYNQQMKDTHKTTSRAQ